MPRKGRKAKKVRLTKYVSEQEEVEYHRFQTYRAHEDGNLTVESSFIEAEMANQTEVLGSLEPDGESFQDHLPADFDTQTGLFEDEGISEHPTKKTVPSVSGIDISLTRRTI